MTFEAGIVRSRSWHRSLTASYLCAGFIVVLPAGVAARAATKRASSARFDQEDSVVK